MPGLDARGQPEAAHPRHGEVHHDKVGLHPLQQLQGLGARGGDARQLRLGQLAQEGAGLPQELGAVVHEHDARRARRILGAIRSFFRGRSFDD